MGEIKSRAFRVLKVLVGLTAIAAAFQAAPNQILYWKCEDAAGPTVTDTSGNGINGTWAGPAAQLSVDTVNLAPNTPGNTRSLLFTKGAVMSTGAYVTTTNSAPTRFTGPFSMMAWIRPTILNAGDNPNNTGAVIYNWNWVNPPGVFNGYGFHRNMSGVIHFYTGTTTVMDTTTSTGTAPDNTWTHVTCVYTGTQKIIYLNGVANTTVANTLNPGATTANFQIGKDDYWRNFYGNIDEVRLFDRALTAAEVDTYYRGAAPPSGLTATPGVNQITLNWNAVTGASGYTILRSQTAGGPYTQIGTTTAPTTTFTDNTAVYPNTYYYVVQSVFGTIYSANSIEVSSQPLPPPVTASPTTGLQTSENGTTTTFNIVFNQAPPAAGSQVTVTSNDPSEGLVSSAASPTPATSITFMVASGFTGNIPITVTGVDDFVADNPVTYSITITATNMPPPAVPNVSVTNNDNDTPNMTISQTGGLFTSESGGQATFSVTFTTQPTAATTVSVVSSNTAEGTVNPNSLSFTAANWNTPHVVTLTGVDDTALDFGMSYTISLTVTGGDPAYVALTAPPNGPRTVGVVNLDNEQIPPLDPVWNGGGGGCGLLGAEAALLALLAALRRRRRSA